MDTLALAVERLGESARLHMALTGEPLVALGRVCAAICKAVARGGRVVFAGSGSTALVAECAAAKLASCGGIPCTALASEMPGTRHVIAPGAGAAFGSADSSVSGVQAWKCSGDVLVALCDDVPSAALQATVELAKSGGMITIVVCGRPSGRWGATADIAVVVPSSSPPRVTECIAALCHLLCELAGTQLTVRPCGTEVVGDGVGLHPGIATLPELCAARQRWRSEQRLLVWTNGCFDLLHVGHIHSLRAAASLGDILVVGVNSDGSVQRLKGSGRPVVPEMERAQVVAALSVVDYVVIFSEDTPELAVTRLQPDVFVKGAEYAPPAGKPVPEAGIVAAYGGQVRFLPMVAGRSTTDLVTRIRSSGAQGAGVAPPDR